MTLQEPIDPHGQGDDLLGFGIIRSGTFIPIERFRFARVTDRHGFPIEKVRIAARSHALHGESDRGVLNREPAEWVSATLSGQVRCTSATRKNELVEIAVQVRGLSSKYIAGSHLRTYELEVEDRGVIANGCRDPDDVALAVNGYWDSTGAHIIDGESFSLACTKRDVVTCLEAGYVDDPEDSTGYSLFKACTRMLRADYCGDGTSYTMDGTFVTIYDNRAIVTEDPLDPLVFEAAWSERGAFCMARPRWASKPPVCRTPIPACPFDVNRTTAYGLALEPLVLNESCVDHPCAVSRIEPEQPHAARSAVLKRGRAHR